MLLEKKKVNVKTFSLPFLTPCLKKKKIIEKNLHVNTFQTVKSLSIPCWHQTDHCQNDETTTQSNVPSGLKISVVSKLCCTKRLTFTISFYFIFKERLIWRSVNSHKNRFNEVFHASEWDVDLWVATSRCWTEESNLLTWTMSNRFKLNEINRKKWAERLQIILQCFSTMHYSLVMILMAGKYYAH